MEDLDALLTVVRETIHKTTASSFPPSGANYAGNSPSTWYENGEADHNQGGHTHPQEPVHTGRDYSTSADGNLETAQGLPVLDACPKLGITGQAPVGLPRCGTVLYPVRSKVLVRRPRL